MTRRTGHLCAALLVLVASLCPVPARAQSDDDSVARAAALYEDGLRKSAKDDFEGALIAFRTAYALAPAAPTLWNIAVLELQLGQKLEAHGDLQTYLTSSGADAPHLREAAATAAEIEKELARLRVEVDVPDASVTVDRKTSALTSWLLPGEHVVRAEVDGRATEKRVQLSAGSDTPVRLSLSRPPVQPDKTARAFGLLFAGAGVISFSVGAVFGIQALQRKPDIDAHCVKGYCDKLGFSSWQVAQSSARVADGAFIAGAVAAGASLALLVISIRPFASDDHWTPPAPPSGARLSVEVGPMTFGLQGAF